MSEFEEQPKIMACHFQGRLKPPGEPIGLPKSEGKKSQNLFFTPEQIEQMGDKEFLKMTVGEDRDVWTFAIKGRRNGNFLLERLYPDSREMESARSHPEKVFTLENP